MAPLPHLSAFVSIVYWHFLIESLNPWVQELGPPVRLGSKQTRGKFSADTLAAFRYPRE